MRHVNKPSNKKVLQFTTPKDGIESHLGTWIRGVVASNDELVLALDRLRRSFMVLLAGKPVTNAEEILWQVEGALTDAERSKCMSAQQDCGPQGA